MAEVATRLSEKERAIGLIQAFYRAPDEAVAELQAGATQEGEPAVMVTIGDEFFPMLAKSARITADIADSAIAQFGDAGGIGALAAALRAAADEAERASPAPTEAPTG